MVENEFWCTVYGRLYADVLDREEGVHGWSREDCAKWAGESADVALAEAKCRGRIAENS